MMLVISSLVYRFIEEPARRRLRPQRKRFLSRISRFRPTAAD